MTGKNNYRYEDEILKEIRALPEESLPRLLRLIRLIRAEFLTREEIKKAQERPFEEVSHQKTRKLLATSEGSWAQDVIAAREDRI